MRVAVSSLLVICFALAVVVVLLAIKKTLLRNQERRKLEHENRMLRNVISLTQKEIEVQEQAGYSDVVAFRHILNDYKELS